MAWSTAEQHRVVEALAITCEVTGTSLSDPAKQFVLRELEAFPAAQVLLSLKKLTHKLSSRLTLAAIIDGMRDQDRKAISDGNARNQAYLTTLRGCALVERIPWEASDLASVEAQLRAKGYKPEKMPGYAAARESPRQLPHWTEGKDAD